MSTTAVLTIGAALLVVVASAAGLALAVRRRARPAPPREDYSAGDPMPWTPLAHRNPPITPGPFARPPLRAVPRPVPPLRRATGRPSAGYVAPVDPGPGALDAGSSDAGSSDGDCST
jgi:hypothetical protein